MGEKWMAWTLLEAFIRSISATLQKLVGVVAHTVGHTLYAAALIGVVQTIFGFTAARGRGAKLVTCREEIIGSVIFGFFAVLSTVLGLLTFLYGGELGVRVFIITLSIVPGTLIDRFFFGKSLALRQHAGIIWSVVAAYAILDRPSLAEVAQFPLWVWLAFANMLTVAVNQGITQKIKAVDPMVKNFWGGLTTITLGVLGMVYLGGAESLPAYEGIAALTVYSLLVGFIVVLLWTVNLYSYKRGAYISLKKLVMNGSYLTMSLAAGVLLFGESLSGWQVAGVFFYATAFILMDDATWRTFTEIVLRPFLARVRG